MSFAAVSWAYKDVITSAKLAQMVENLRTHDHFTTDQGQRVGLLGTTGFTAGVNSTTIAPVTATTLTVTIPTGLTAGRTVLLLMTGRVSSAAGVAATVDITNTTGQAVLTAGSADYVMALAKVDVSPPAGSRGYALTLASSVAGQTVTLQRVNLHAILL